MGIGSGIALFITGAIVAFALNFKVAAVNQNLIGYLLMGGGALVFLISLFASFKKRSTTVKPTRQLMQLLAKKAPPRTRRATHSK